MPRYVSERNSRDLPLAAHRHIVDVAAARGVAERRATNPAKQAWKLNRMSHVAVSTPQLETRKSRNTLPGFAHRVAPSSLPAARGIRFDHRLRRSLLLSQEAKGVQRVVQGNYPCSAYDNSNRGRNCQQVTPQSSDIHLTQVKTTSSVASVEDYPRTPASSKS